MKTKNTKKNVFHTETRYTTNSKKSTLHAKITQREKKPEKLGYLHTKKNCQAKKILHTEIHYQQKH